MWDGVPPFRADIASMDDSDRVNWRVFTVVMLVAVVAAVVLFLLGAGPRS
jgi:hypothetical protein